MFTSSPEHPERWYLTWGNEGKDRSMFLHGDGLLNITKWWSLYSSLTYVLTSQKLTDAGYFDTFGYLQLVASTTFTLPQRFSCSLNCFYNSRMKIGNITVYPILNLNPTLQKQFGNHWSLSLGVEDILQRSAKLRTESSIYKRLSYTKLHATVKLGVTYKFNSGKKFGIRRIEKSTDNSRFYKD